MRHTIEVSNGTNLAELLKAFPYSSHTRLVSGPGQDYWRVEIELEPDRYGEKPYAFLCLSIEAMCKVLDRVMDDKELFGAAKMELCKPLLRDLSRLCDQMIVTTRLAPEGGVT